MNFFMTMPVLFSLKNKNEKDQDFFFLGWCQLQYPACIAFYLFYYPFYLKTIFTRSHCKVCTVLQISLLLPSQLFESTTVY